MQFSRLQPAENMGQRRLTRYEFTCHICQEALVRLIPVSTAYLTVRPFFFEFRKSQLIESLELMRFSHFWGKLAANLPPKLPTTEETRFSF
jgi:hypothetical protein